MISLTYFIDNSGTFMYVTTFVYICLPNLLICTIFFFCEKYYFLNVTMHIIKCWPRNDCEAYFSIYKSYQINNLFFFSNKIIYLVIIYLLNRMTYGIYFISDLVRKPGSTMCGEFEIKLTHLNTCTLLIEWFYWTN